MQYLSVKFNGADRSYTYKVPKGLPSINPGDYVVVNTPSNGMQVVKVLEVDLPVPSFKCKFVVDVVNLDLYHEARKEEQVNQPKSSRL